MFYRETWADIDLDALEENIKKCEAWSGKAVFAVIKANGYGHGDEFIARKAIAAGAKMLMVSSMDEALSLRNKKIVGDILIMGYNPPKDVRLAIKHDIRLTVTSLEWLLEVVKSPVKGLVVHVKYDTGMNRLGVKALDDVKEILTLCDRHGIQVEGMYTHFASSDDEDNVLTGKQFHRFEELLDELKREFKWIHCANTDAALHFPENRCNGVRIGLAIYGYSTFRHDLKPVMRLYSKIVHVKQVEAGETVSYGATYSPTKTEWIATIPIGYADGWNRKHQGDVAYIGDEPCVYVGRVCMDQLMLRLERYHPVDTVVELLGDHANVEKMAKHMDTIPYEILTQVSDRIPKCYYEHGVKIGEVHSRMK
jgi:alanine racemase